MEHWVANTVTLAEDECSYTLGLADDPADPKHYLILQRTKDAGQLYFESDEQANGSYCEPRKLLLSRTRMEWTYASTVENLPDVITTVAVGLDLPFADWSNLRDGLVHGLSIPVEDLL